MKCRKCLLDKPEGEFRLQRGKWRGKVCYVCTKKDNAVRTRLYYWKDRTPYVKQDPEVLRKKQSEYYKKWYAENGRKRNPLQQKAHTLVAAAKTRGELVIPESCPCGNTERIEAHHEDYNKPLDVVFLCNKCHRTLHKGTIPLAT